MATLNAATWTQARTYVNNFLNTGDISGQGNVQLPVPATPDLFVASANVLFQQVIKKHGGDGAAYHNHTGTAGTLLALLDKIRESGNPELARTLASSIYNNGAGVGYVMTAEGNVPFRGTSGCTRADLRNFLNGGGVFQGVWAGRQ